MLALPAAVLPEDSIVLVLVFFEVKGIVRITARLDVTVVIVKRLLLDVLVFRRNQLVPDFHCLRGLLKRHGEDPAIDLSVEVALVDRALAKCHHKSLSNCTATLVLELVVN